MGRPSKLAEWNHWESVVISDKRYLEMQAFMSKQLEKVGITGVLADKELKRLLYKLLDIGQSYCIKAIPTNVSQDVKVTDIKVNIEISNGSKTKSKATQDTERSLHGQDPLSYLNSRSAVG